MILVVVFRTMAVLRKCIQVFGHYQDDQEAQECPPSGDLGDFGCLDQYFVTVIAHMIPFCNPQNHYITQEVYSGLLITIRMIRKVKNVLQVVICGVLGVLMGIL